MRALTLGFLAFAAFGAATCGAGAAAPDAITARAFVAGLYSHYPSSPNGQVFSPTDKNAADVFDPGMIALIKEDEKLANGEVGFIDADPLCQCQDDGGIKVTITSVTMKAANAATAVVDLHFPQGKPNPLTLHLVVVNGKWRVYDLSAPGMASFRADLAKANKEAAAGHH
jgi:hypothetical protein